MKCNKLREHHQLNLTEYKNRGVSFLRWVASGVWVGIALFLVGCPSTYYRPVSSTIVKKIENVPFYPAEHRQCGPASLASVMNHWRSKEHVTVREISDSIYSPNAGGTLTADMAWYARERGFTVLTGPRSVSEIKHLINKKIPVIAFVESPGRSGGHYVVVHGYTRTGFIVHSDSNKSVEMPFATFRQLRTSTQWTLVILSEARGSNRLIRGVDGVRGQKSKEQLQREPKSEQK
ncbi:MAG: C39 family peptidase [bacterium]